MMNCLSLDKGSSFCGSEAYCVCGFVVCGGVLVVVVLIT